MNDKLERAVLADAYRILESAARYLKKASIGSDVIVTPRDAKNIMLARSKVHAALARIPDQDVVERLIRDRTMPPLPRPKFYECGGCGHLHPFGWAGDCRNDATRYSNGELDVQFGDDGWESVDERTGDVR